MKSRMKGDFHVRFRENAGVKFPCVTRLAAIGRSTAVKKVHFKWINFYGKRERTFPFKLWQKICVKTCFQKLIALQSLSKVSEKK